MTRFTFIIGSFVFLGQMVLAESFLSKQLNDSGSQTSPMFGLRTNLPDEARHIFSLWKRGERREAVHLAHQWIKENKKNPTALVVAAELHYKSGRLGKCKRFAKKALKVDPNNAIAYYWRGRVYQKKGKKLEAANEYRAAVLAQKGFMEAERALNKVTAAMAQQADNS